MLRVVDPSWTEDLKQVPNEHALPTTVKIHSEPDLALEVLSIERERQSHIKLRKLVKLD